MACIRTRFPAENASGAEVKVTLAPGQETNLRVTLVNGGSATTPVNLIVVNELGKAPNEDPK